ncbi:hypothetical protein HDU93_007210 [Gonapodya sp. JEL0774]|nr:hypothetical protein HDU93_007210 [Gonapodya sp. JEL0774]
MDCLLFLLPPILLRTHPPFVPYTAFGAPAGQPSAFGGFGAAQAPQQSGGLFGGAASTFGAGGFGAPRPTGGLFGAPAATQAPSAFSFGAATQAAAPSAFGAPTNSLFGARPPATTAPAFSFGGAAPFGAPAQPAAQGFGFGAGAAAGGMTSDAANNGTGNPKFQQTADRDTAASLSQGNFQTITAMDAYKKWSLEELRLKDYELGRKTAGAAPASGGLFGAAQPASGGFGFGAATTQPATGGLFGAPAAASPFGAPATSQPATGGFGFGQPAATGGSLFGQPAQPAATGFGFGQQQPAAGAFGAQPQAGAFGSAPATGGFGFGAPASSAPAASPFSFGAPATSTAAPSLFGAPAAAPAFGGGFGAAPAGGSLFGQKPATTQATAFGGFGAAAATTQAPTSSFGFGAPATSSGGLFGAKPPTTGGFSFGAATSAAPAAPTQAFSFGAPQQPAAGGFGFGAPAATQAAGSLFGGAGAFGTATQPAATGAGLFGNPAAPTGGLFGGTAGAFGSSFGAPKPPTTGGFSFGAGSGFGAPALTTQPLAQSVGTGFSGFGMQSTQPGSGSLFGTNSTFGQQAGGLFGASGPFGYNAGGPVGSLQAEVDKNPYGSVPAVPALLGASAPAQTPAFTPLAASKKRPAPVPQFRTTPRAATRLALRGVPAVPPSERGSAWGSDSHGTDLLAPELFVPKKSWKRLDWEDVEEVERSVRSSEAADGSFMGGRPGFSAGSGQLVIPAAQDERNKGKDSVNGAPGRADNVSTPPTYSDQTRVTSNNPSSLSPPPTRKAVPDPSDYSTSPPMDEIMRMSDEELTHVKDFVVTAKGFGKVKFLKPVDLMKAAKGNKRRIRDIPGTIVTFTPKELTVYPDDDSADPRGEGLNVNAEISLEGCWPRDPNTRKDVKVDGPLADAFVRKLRAKPETDFVSYVLATGTWTFKVAHFSRYGLLDDDDEKEYPVAGGGTRGSVKPATSTANNQPVASTGGPTRDGKTLVRPLIAGSDDDVEEMDATFIENSFAFMEGRRIVREIDLITEVLDEGVEDQEEGEEDIEQDFEEGNFSRRQSSFFEDDSEIVPQPLFASDSGVAAGRTMGQAHMASGLADASPEIARNVQAAKASIHFGRAGSSDVNQRRSRVPDTVEAPRAGRVQPSAQVVPDIRASVGHRLEPEDFQEYEEDAQQVEEEFDRDEDEQMDETTIAAEKGKQVVRAPQLFFDEDLLPRSQPPLRHLGVVPRIRFSHVLNSPSGSEAQFVDSGLSLGRSFRVGWGPGGIFLGRGKAISEPRDQKYDCSTVVLFQHDIFGTTDKRNLPKPREQHVGTMKVLLKNADIHRVHNGFLDGAPSISVNADIKFASFCEEVGQEGSLYDAAERLVWNLSSALWDPLDIPGVTSDLPGDVQLSEEQKSLIAQRWRKEAITAWLKEAVRKDMENSVDTVKADRNSGIKTVFALLTGRQVARACQQLVRNRDLRLATIVSQMGGSGVGPLVSPRATSALANRQDGASGHGIPGSGQLSVQTMSAVEAQLQKWTTNQGQDLLSKDYMRVWQLASGNVASTNILSEVTDWKRTFGLFLWYGKGGGATVAEALEAYDIARSQIQGVADPRPSYLELSSRNGSRRRSSELLDRKDILYHMLRLYADPSYPLERALNPLNASPRALDCRVPWLLHSVMSSRNPPVGTFAGARTDHNGDDSPEMETEWNSQDVAVEAADRLTMGMVFQLEAIGLWHWAIFACSFLGRPESRESAIRYLLNTHLPFDHVSGAQADHFGSLEWLVPNDEDMLDVVSIEPVAGSSHSVATKRWTFLTETLKIPETWIHEAKALRAGYMGDIRRQVAHLIDARKWNDAHALIVGNLAPELILNGQHASLKSLLSRFADTSVVTSWPEGGSLLLEYIAALEPGTGASGSGSGTGTVSSSLPDLGALKQRLEIEAVNGGRGNVKLGSTQEEIRAAELRRKVMWKIMSARIAATRAEREGKAESLCELTTTKEEERMAALVLIGDGFAM